MVIAGFADVATLRIPNRLLAVATIGFFPFALMTGMPGWMLALHLLSASVLLAIGYGLFMCGVLGGGDAKMMAVAGLWLGYPCSILFVVFSVLAGGLLAGAAGLWCWINLEGRLRSDRMNRVFSSFVPNLPYGFALAAGAILATPFSWWMRIATS